MAKTTGKTPATTGGDSATELPHPPKVLLEPLEKRWMAAIQDNPLAAYEESPQAFLEFAYSILLEPEYGAEYAEVLEKRSLTSSPDASPADPEHFSTDKLNRIRQEGLQVLRTHDLLHLMGSAIDLRRTLESLEQRMEDFEALERGRLTRES